MSVELQTLHMVSLQLDSRGLVELARRRRLSLREMDTGYVVHCALGELFGSAAPKPFSIVGSRGRHVQVLAYAAADERELREQYFRGSRPWLGGLCDLTTLASKEMPSEWVAGSRFGFSVRVCPVVRVGRGSQLYRPGAEVDAFLARCTTLGSDARVNRYEVYEQWFEEQLQRCGGARVITAGVEAFQLGSLVRRTHDEQRKSSLRTRPDVIVSGELEVTNAEEFGTLLQRGIGRHRAFGYGMLLLRRNAR